MPAAPRPDYESEDEMEPRTPVDAEAALEGSGKKRKKDKKDKSKKHKMKIKETPTEENELSDTELEPPKPKKSKKKKEVFDDIEVIIAEHNTTPSATNGVGKSKKQGNTEESNTECESDQDQELTEEQKEGDFANFNLSKATIDLLKARGVTYLFPVQVKTYKHISDGKDVIAQARTGTGKTFSFAIPLIEKLQGDPQERKRGRTPKVLVLTPTRELAMQVARDFKDVTRKLTVACFYGGTAYNGQLDLMRNGIDILVGTPGRIKDHLQNNKLDISNLKHVVLDEVDQMLDMGFALKIAFPFCFMERGCKTSIHTLGKISLVCCKPTFKPPSWGAFSPPGVAELRLPSAPDSVARDVGSRSLATLGGPIAPDGSTRRDAFNTRTGLLPTGRLPDVLR